MERIELRSAFECRKLEDTTVKKYRVRINLLDLYFPTKQKQIKFFQEVFKCIEECKANPELYKPVNKNQFPRINTFVESSNLVPVYTPMAGERSNLSSSTFCKQKTIGVTLSAPSNNNTPEESKFEENMEDPSEFNKSITY
jgi:hypothetical protein